MISGREVVFTCSTDLIYDYSIRMACSWLKLLKIFYGEAILWNFSC